MISRRSFTKTVGIGVGASFLPKIGFSEESIEHHQQVASKVKSKFSGQELTVLYPKGSLANLRPIAKSFFEMAKVKVNLKEGSLDSISSEVILSSKLGGKHSTFDVGIPATFAIPDIAEANAIVDLSALAAEHEPQGFRKNWLYSVGDYYKSKFYGYQADGDTYLMFLNREWLESPKFRSEYKSRFGVDLGVPKTWKELDRQILFFNRPESNMFGGSLYRNSSYTIWEFWMRLHAKGVFPVNDNFEPQLMHKKSLEAFSELIEVSKHLDPRVRSQGLFENFKSYSQGNKFCNLGWGGTQKYLHGKSSKMKDRIIFALPPGNKIGNIVFSVPYFNWGWNYVVSTKSRKQELAYLFCLFASTRKISTLAVSESEGFFDPYIEEHYDNRDIVKSYGKDFLGVHRKALKASIPDFYVKGQGRYNEALKESLEAVLKGNISAAKALKDVAKKWESITEIVGREGQMEQWQFLKKRYPEKVRKVLV